MADIKTWMDFFVVLVINQAKKGAGNRHGHGGHSPRRGILPDLAHIALPLPSSL